MSRFRRKRFRGSKVTRQVFKNKAVLSRLKGAVERKSRLSRDEANLDIDATETHHMLTIINQGDSDGTREGEKISIRTLFIRGFIHNDNSAAADGLVRIILWRQNQPQGADPVLVDNVLENIDINSPQNWARKSAVKVLFDNTFVMDTTQHTIIPFKIRLQGLTVKTFYEGSGGGTADAIKNHYYLGWFGTNSGATIVPRLDYSCRVTYDDM